MAQPAPIESWKALMAKLQTALGSDQVYFQPPESRKLTYPCIVFSETRPNVRFANNDIYRDMKAFKVTYMDALPTSAVPDAIKRIRYSSLEQIYKSGNLNHYVFTIYS